MGVGLLNTPLVSTHNGRLSFTFEQETRHLCFKVSCFNFSVTFKDNHWNRTGRMYIRISIDQGVSPDLTRFMWLFIDVASENMLSLSTSQRSFSLI